MSNQTRSTDATTDPHHATLLSVTDLRTTFATTSGAVCAVDGVSFELARGQTLGIVGESGSGKSVLARSVMGLLPKRGVSLGGSVRFKGAELVNMPERDLRRRWGAEIAMVLQDPMTSLQPVTRVGQRIAEPLQFHLGLRRGDASAAAVELLRSVRIGDPERRLREYPHQLSGGMRQRVCIAAALSCRPDLLIADEPTTALDVTVQRQILDLLGVIRADNGMAMILITHDLGVVAGRTDMTAVMYAGQLVEIAKTRELFTEPRMPYTRALLRAIPRLDQPSHRRLQAIEGRPPDPRAPRRGCRFAPRCEFARQRCTEEEPPLTQAGGSGHLARCWFPVDTSDPATPDSASRTRRHAVVGTDQESGAGAAPERALPGITRDSAIGGST